MDCERYKTSLADAAAELSGVAGGAREALSPACAAEMRVHLESCAACRQELEAQRRLLAAIERGLAANLGQEPSPEFAVRVRQRLAEERLPARAWFSGWVPVAAGALAVLALVAVWFVQRDSSSRGTMSSARKRSGSQQAQNVVPAPQESIGPRRVPAERVPRAPADLGADFAPKAVGSRAARSAEPEVLVPPGQRDAVLSFYAAALSRRADVSSLFREQRPLEPEELKIPRLEVAPLDTERKPSEPGREG